MATFKSDAVANDMGYIPFPQGDVGVRAGEYTISAALAAADVIQLVNINKGETVLGYFLEVPDLDTNGSPAITLDLGTDGDTDLFLDNSNLGQAGGTSNLLVKPVTFAADGSIDLKVATGPATGATSGTIKLSVLVAA